jgi:hypothetical protein
MLRLIQKWLKAGVLVAHGRMWWRRIRHHRLLETCIPRVARLTTDSSVPCALMGRMSTSRRRIPAPPRRECVVRLGNGASIHVSVTSKRAPAPRPIPQAQWRHTHGGDCRWIGTYPDADGRRRSRRVPLTWRLSGNVTLSPQGSPPRQRDVEGRPVCPGRRDGDRAAMRDHDGARDEQA